MTQKVEATLDPQDWDSIRGLGHRMLDDAFAFLRDVRKRPVWQPMPPQAKDHFREGVPLQPKDLAQVYEEFKKFVLPYPVGNIHPRFWGWAQGTGTVNGVLAEIMATAMNPNAWGGNQSAVYVERQVIYWMKEVIGFPMASSGVMTSGASMATLIGLAVARKKKAPHDVRVAGVHQAHSPLRVYCSREAHNSVVRAAELLGIGSSNVVSIPVDDDGRMSIDSLQEEVAKDQGAGSTPLCVVGTAGSVGFGAIDDLKALAEFCRRENIWLHVDGAIGAVAKCSRKLAPLFDGIQQADSVAFDFHKWLFVPYEAGCVLIRDARAHRETFASPAHYLSQMDGGVTDSSEIFFNDYGPELSRGMKALKVWMAIKEAGIDKLAEVMEQNVEQAAYLSRKIAQEPKLELLAPVPLNIVCFRYRWQGMIEAELDRANRRLLVAIQESGIAVPSPIVRKGIFGIRVCIMNHRTRYADLDLFFDAVLRLASSVEKLGRFPENESLERS